MGDGHEVHVLYVYISTLITCVFIVTANGGICIGVHCFCVPFRYLFIYLHHFHFYNFHFPPFYLLFFNLLQQLPSCVSCSSSSYVSKNSTSSPFSSPSHYSLSCAYMNSWPYPLFVHHLHICCNNSFLSYSLLLLSIVITRTLDLPSLSYSSCSSLFCSHKRFWSSLLIHSIRLYCESFPFSYLLFSPFSCAYMSSQPFPFLLYLMLTKALLFPIRHIYLFLFIGTFCTPVSYSSYLSLSCDYRFIGLF